MLGGSGKCRDGVGLKGANMVYRLLGKNIRLFYLRCLLQSHVTLLSMNVLCNPSKLASVSSNPVTWLGIIREEKP